MGVAAESVDDDLVTKLIPMETLWRPGLEQMVGFPVHDGGLAVHVGH